MRSISEIEGGSASAPIVTSRPSARPPCVLSTIDLVEFEVPRITSALPAVARLLPPRRPHRRPDRGSSCLYRENAKTAMVSKPAPFAYCIQATLYTTIAVAKTTGEHQQQQRTNIGGLGWVFCHVSARPAINASLDHFTTPILHPPQRSTSVSASSQLRTTREMIGG
jgi:hypothetical protein